MVLKIPDLYQTKLTLTAARISIAADAQVSVWRPFRTLSAVIAAAVCGRSFS